MKRRVTLFFDLNTLVRLDLLCAVSGRTRSGLVEDLINRVFDEHRGDVAALFEKEVADATIG